jgi:hypothetical protein
MLGDTHGHEAALCFHGAVLEDRRYRVGCSFGAVRSDREPLPNTMIELLMTDSRDFRAPLL